MPSSKIAIVTGAAGGIGLAYTKHLLDRGYRVVLADLNSERGVELQQELGPDALFVHCDVADWESQAAMFKAAYAWGGRLDVFIANAGIEEREPFYGLPDGDGEPAKPDMRVLEVDLDPIIYGLRLVRHYARRSGNREVVKMIVTNSIAGFYTFSVAPMYSAAKHAVVGLVRASSHKLLKNESIAINAISPGPVDTTISAMMKKVVPIEHFTPISLLIQVLDMIIDEDITGQVIECSNRSYYLRQPADYSDDNSRFLIEDMKRL